MAPDEIPAPARKHHYAFAHLAMRGLIEASPMHVLMTLLDRARGSQLLDEVWQEVAGQCAADERIEPEGLAYEIHELSDHRPLILLEFPTPRGAREAYFAAAVIQPPRRRFFVWPQPAQVRYFTLERGNPARGDFDILLGEWCGEAHLSYSDNPEANRQAFLRAVVGVLRGKTKPLGATDHPAALADA